MFESPEVFAHGRYRYSIQARVDVPSAQVLVYVTFQNNEEVCYASFYTTEMIRSIMANQPWFVRNNLVIVNRVTEESIRETINELLDKRLVLPDVPKAGRLIFGALSK